MKKLYFLIISLLIINLTNAQWQQTNGPHDGVFNDFAIIGTDVYAATNKGVFVSTNNGNSWTKLSHIPSYSIYFDGTNLFAGSMAGGVYISTDYGLNWTQTALQSETITTIARNGTDLFVGSWNGNIYHTNNNGLSWTLMNNGSVFSSVHEIEFIGANIFATTSNGVFISSNSGASWTASNNGLLFDEAYSVVAYGSDIYVSSFGGLYKSINNGANWNLLTNSVTPNDMVFDGTDLLVCSNNGVFISSDFGINWTALNNGIFYTWLNCIAVIGNDLYAGTAGGIYGRGVFVSHDYGLNWSTTGVIKSEVYALYANDTMIFASVDTGGIFNSLNELEWNECYNGTYGRIQCFEKNGNDLYAGSSYGAGLFHSTNNGGTWNLLNNGLTNGYVNAIAFIGSDIYLGTHGGAYVSYNNGANWTIINNGLSGEILSLLTIGTDLYAGGVGGMYKSTNGGLNWTSINNGLTNYDIRSLVVIGTKIFAASYNGGIFVSNNYGANWTSANNGLTNDSVQVLIVEDTILFAGTDGSGVFMSDDGGLNWIDINLGLGNYYILSLAISDNSLYSGTYGDGVWKRPLSELIVSKEKLQKDNAFKIFPNPTTDLITIDAENINKIELCDIHGRQVYTGKNNTIDLSQQPQGIYIIKITTDKLTISKKIIKQ